MDQLNSNVHKLQLTAFLFGAKMADGGRPGYVCNSSQDPHAETLVEVWEAGPPQRLHQDAHLPLLMDRRMEGTCELKCDFVLVLGAQ